MKGHLVYSGSISNCQHYFENLEFPKMDTKANPAEYLIGILSDLPLNSQSNQIHSDNNSDNNKHTIEYLSTEIQQQYHKSCLSILSTGVNNDINNNNTSQRFSKS